jgi:NADH dehydrogenase FAD-containing subunit
VTYCRSTYLILATGVVPWYGTIPGAAEYAIPLKMVIDAIRMLLRSFAALLGSRASPDHACDLEA